MTQSTFDDAIAEIYATFGRAVPAGAVRDTLFDRTSRIPDEAAAYIVERVCDQERLPQNMSREFRNAWADWRAARPSGMVRRRCPACGDVGVRHGWSRDERGRWRSFSVPCPACQTDASRPPVSMRDLERRGCLFMPPDYPGGPVSFDRDNGLNCLWPADLDMASPRTEMRVGVDMRPRSGRGVPPPEDRGTVSP